MTQEAMRQMTQEAMRQMTQEAMRQMTQETLPRAMPMARQVPMARRALRSFACALAVVLAATGSAGAQPAAAQAEAQFERGKKLMAEGKTGEACEAFESSQKLDPLVTTLLNLAACREKNGELASAWGWFVEAERQTRGKTGGQRKLNQTAKERGEKLAGRLSKLTIAVPHELPGLEVLRNSDRVERGTWNAPLPVDGGSVAITARAPGYREWSTRVVIAIERDDKTVKVPELIPVGGAAAPAGDAEQPKGRGEPDARPASAQARGGSRMLPIALAVAGGVLGGGAVGFELWGRSKYDAARTEPDDAAQESLWKAANARRYTAIGLGAAAAVSISAAVVLFVRAPRAGQERAETAEGAGSAKGVSVLPVAGADVAGLAVLGSF